MLRNLAKSRAVFWNAVCLLTTGTALFVCACSDPGDSPGASTRKIASRQEPIPITPEKAVASETGEISEAAFLEQVGQARDFFAWHALQKKYAETGTQNARIESALQQKETELRKKAPPYAINDHIEMAAFRWKLQGAPPAVGQDANFTASWLFYKKDPVHLEPGQSAFLILRGIPEKAHAQFVKTRPYGQPMFERTFAIGVDKWPEGGYHLVAHTFSAPFLPYDMTTFVVLRGGQEAGAYGSRVRLGWQADVGE